MQRTKGTKLLLFSVINRLADHATKRFASSRNLLALCERHGFISNYYPREKGHDIAAFLEKDQRSIYAGFDPTASSLHIGNLMVICGLLHAQKAGHKSIGTIFHNFILSKKNRNSKT